MKLRMHRRFVFHIVLLIFFCVRGAAAQTTRTAVIPLIHAHAHNDYEHPRPLLDALDCGFCSVEADVFLVGDKLFVGHSWYELRPERTLVSLYLDPLKKRIAENGGRVF